MISHKYKCIFIHIAKCAGTSVENAFGIDTKNHCAEENDYLFGWDKSKKLWLQHATPQQLMDLNLISREHWNNYYKFIIYRNSWARAYSDYLWMKNIRGINDDFLNYINKKGNFDRILNDKNNNGYAGDHLYLQKDYFFLDGKRIDYNRELDFDKLNLGFLKIIQDLSLPNDFFKEKLNKSEKRHKSHYSFFYTGKRKNIVQEKYREDIEYFGFEFEEKKNLVQKLLRRI